MTKRNPAVEKKLVGLADMVIASAQKKRDPSISIPVRSLSNVSFNAKKGYIEMGSNKQLRTFFNVAMAYAVLRHNGVDIGKMDFLGPVNWIDA